MTRFPPPTTPRRKPKTPGVRPFPTKDEILAFISASKGKVGKREIARHFSLNPAEQDAAQEGSEGAGDRGHG